MESLLILFQDIHGVVVNAIGCAHKELCEERKTRSK